MGGRRQGVGGAAPDIASTVAIEVHGVGVVGGRDELGLAHGARPGAQHFLGFDIALLEDLQGGDQLRVSETGATPFVGQGGQ
ncbi:hypothetical protein D3C76_919360 [compost metagenome]